MPTNDVRRHSRLQGIQGFKAFKGCARASASLEVHDKTCATEQERDRGREGGRDGGRDVRECVRVRG